MVGKRDVVGRRAELAALAEFLDALDRGPAALAFTGPAGMGKTTVWRRGADLAQERSWTVLTARPSGAEARFAYAALADLLAPVGKTAFEALPAVQRGALDAALLRGELGTAPVQPRAVATGLLTLVCELARAAPVVLAVDDVQWLDRASSAALAFALRRVAGDAVGVLATVRIADARPATFLDAVPSGLRSEVELGPLSAATIHAIVRQELGRGLPRPTLVKVVSACGGNPLYALEIARELFRLGELPPGAALPVPDQIQALVRARVHRLPPETRDALLVAACQDAPRADGLREEALAPAEEAGLVRLDAAGRIAFEHPLFAAAVYESAAISRRRAVHRALAERAGDAEERARHLALGSAGPDVDVARRLADAALAARARGAPVASAELIELALRLTPGPIAGERLLLAASIEFDAGDLLRAQSLLERAVAVLDPGPTRARALQRLGQLHTRRNNFDRALELAGRALAEPMTEPELRAQVELDIAYCKAALGDLPASIDHIRAAAEAAEQAGSDPLLAQALACETIGRFMCGLGLAQGTIERALALEGLHQHAPLVLQPSYIHGVLELWSGRPREALAIHERLRRRGRESGIDSELPLLFLYLVWGALWVGDLARARRYVEEAAALADALEDRTAVALALAIGSLASAYAGEAEATRDKAARAAALFEELGDRTNAITPAWAIGFLELSLGNAAGVDAALGPLSAQLVALPGDPVLLVFLPDELEALVELGQLDRAAALLEPFESRSRALDRHWAIAAALRCRGLLRAAAGDLDGALESLEEALRHHPEALPFERGRTLLVLGEVQRRCRHKRLARASFEEALAVFEAVGAPLWIARAVRERARVTARRSPSGLTATEERIARLAAEGLTNQSIANRAFVAVGTVEANLSRAYRKLGITSRAQLARALDGLEP
jgi:DNA-binding CsgD family transcriptional regulator